MPRVGCGSQARSKGRYGPIHVRTMAKVGVVGIEARHSLRYASAVGQIQHYTALGFTDSEANAMASTDLGLATVLGGTLPVFTAELPLLADRVQSWMPLGGVAGST